MENENLVGSVMVIGSGIAGIQASLDLADSGFLVHLVEKQPQIGGVMAQLDKTFPTNDCAMCVISPKLVEAGRHLNIDLHTMARVEKVEGDMGNFTVTLVQEPRYVDLDKCTACGECVKVCPVEVKNDFDQGLRTRNAIYKLYPQGMPGAFAVDKRSVAPCKATCPAHVSIQGFIALMNQGKHHEALKLFKQEHPFPGSCGRVCHHPCESVCTRGDADQPLAIQYLHRYIAQLDLDSEEGPWVPDILEERPEKVAVVGSGPAGLTAAYYLAQKGYKVTIFEKLPVKGGMMAVGIPEYRLPKAELAKEIDVIEKLGVEIKTSVEFGKDITLESLKKEGYASLFMATGLHGSRGLGVKGEDLEGVLKGTEFLRNAAMGKGEKLSGKVIVIGGGNVAVDVALTARRLGSDDVTMVCLEKRDEMPAWDYEIEEALEEKVHIVNSQGPLRFYGDDSGKVNEVSFQECTAVFDENGRFNPQYDDCKLTSYEADTVIVAIGQMGETGFAGKEGIALTPPGGYEADPVTLQTPIDWVFAGGDAYYGPKSVVDAIASGKTAAESIHRFINGLDLFEDREKSYEFEKPEIENVPRLERVHPDKISVADREGNFKEVTLDLALEAIEREVSRCLSCGICSECYQCVEACVAGAVDHFMTPQKITLNVGAVIASPGFIPFDPSLHAVYNYLSHPNVVTSLEFERILSASGPYEGHLVRPSDETSPKKIAWLQCTGSRDVNTCDNAYCSSVCCMYAVKQTVIAKEHSPEELDTAVFFMDMRTYGKEFDRYYLRARDEAGVRFVRSRVHTVEPHENQTLMLRYITESGDLEEEIFDMVVLSVGLVSGEGNQELAQTLDIGLNRHKFAETRDLTPVQTGRKGIYACGVFQGPKDIPQSVMEASAAAACAAQALAPARGTLTRTRDLPPEKDFSGQPPRVGVFVCNCGINIGGIADVPEVRDYAATLPNVVHVEDNLFTCSQDTQDKIKEVILEKDINRVVVASCSPRTHEPLFQETIREAGLNKYLFEMANIRDQNTWVHMNNPDLATKKAKDLVSMAVAKANCIEPLYQTPLNVIKALLVVGGGAAGMEAALCAADQEFDVILVEREDHLGGVAKKLLTTAQGEKIPPYLKSLSQKVMEHERIRVLLNAQVVGTGGIMGNFSTEIMVGGNREGETGKIGALTVEHGATILATGGSEYQPREFLYKEHPEIYTHLDLNRALDQEDDKIFKADTIVFIQCVGSRNEERPYCSKICCTNTMIKALKIKEKNPQARIFVLYRDIRTYGVREDLYTRARNEGILFIRYDEDHPPQVSLGDSQTLEVRLHEKILDRKVLITPDALILAAAVIPNENKELFEQFKVPVNADGFLNEAHAKLRPVDFASEGIFLAGLAHYPKSLDESIAQGRAAVARAACVLSRDKILVGGVVAENRFPDKCARCLVCVRSCPYGVPKVVDGHAYIEPALCHGCGVCAAECPAKIITLNHFTDRQINEKSKALFA
ncbi:FAD-dependent oxidoreductase [Desulfospira joergensenii]|uniref:FAD-dependent oxidoreductase n=1 Tax=Desulfospira joergensenii TaxID=53329 RepID=UPI0004843C3F|nr:FAD-dependent oxidoreductase [Desulfospira joergensenii]